MCVILILWVDLGGTEVSVGKEPLGFKRTYIVQSAGPNIATQQ